MERSPHPKRPTASARPHCFERKSTNAETTGTTTMPYQNIGFRFTGSMTDTQFADPKPAPHKAYWKFPLPLSSSIWRWV